MAGSVSKPSRHIESSCLWILPLFPAPIRSIPYLVISKGSFSVPTAVLFKSHLRQSLQVMLKSAFVFENKAFKSSPWSHTEEEWFCDNGLNPRSAFREFLFVLSRIGFSVFVHWKWRILSSCTDLKIRRNWRFLLQVEVYVHHGTFYSTTL